MTGRPITLKHLRPGLRGFTLLECVVVALVVAVLSSIAWPSFRRHELQAGRLDAVQALSRLQAAQERYRSAHGLYAPDLSVLSGASAQSPQGRYTIHLVPDGAEGYLARAQALGQQVQDRPCAALTLQVKHGFAQQGPEASCWRQ